MGRLRAGDAAPDVLDGAAGGRHRREMDAGVPQRRVDPVACRLLFWQPHMRPAGRHLARSQCSSCANSHPSAIYLLSNGLCNSVHACMQP